MINKAFEYRLNLYESGENISDINLLYIAQFYAIRGQHEETLKYLKQIDIHSVKPLFFLIQLEEGPYLQDFRTDKVFQAICNSIKTTWQEEHERVRLWLMENDML